MKKRIKIAIYCIISLYITLSVFIQLKLKYAPPVVEVINREYLEIFKDTAISKSPLAIMQGNGHNNFLSVWYEKDNKWVYSFLVARQRVNSNFSFDSIENLKYIDKQSADMKILPDYYMFMYGDDSSTLQHLSLGFDSPKNVLRVSDSVQIYSFSLQNLNVFINNNSVPIYKLKFAPSENDAVKFVHMPMNLMLLRKKNYLYFIFQISSNETLTDPKLLYNMISL